MLENEILDSLRNELQETKRENFKILEENRKLKESSRQLEIKLVELEE